MYDSEKKKIPFIGWNFQWKHLAIILEIVWKATEKHITQLHEFIFVEIDKVPYW